MSVCSFVAPCVLVCCPAASPALGSPSRAQDEAAPVVAPLTAAVVDVSPTRMRQMVDALVGFGTRHSGSETASDTRGIGAARRWIEADLNASRLASGGRLQVRTQRFLQKIATDREGGSKEVEMMNVYGFLPGTTGERTYLVSGHYDSINGNSRDSTGDAPGANDDASGTAVVLEAARVLSPHVFDANLVFLCVPGEEQGLLGSRHFSEQMEEEGLLVTAMLTNDIVGGAHGSGFEQDHGTVRVFSGGDAPDSPARELSRLIADSARQHVPGFAVRHIFHLDRSNRGGDHIPFHALDIPAVRFTEAREDYRRQHKHVAPDKSTGDLPEFTSPEYMANVARVNVAVLARLASAPPPPKRLRVSGSMSHQTKLSWEASKGAVGYEVLWRETTAPDWEHNHRVEGTSVILDVTIDDVYWAVRAVGAGGHSGLPAVARRRR